jgi:hypothetical protein
MNAIAFTREVRAVFGAPRKMAARTAQNNILRGSHRTAQVRCRENSHLTGERSAFVPGMTVPV